ncbi:MAG: hypothetical protein ABIN36_19375 [Ferruginibacter sp.]
MSKKILVLEVILALFIMLGFKQVQQQRAPKSIALTNKGFNKQLLTIGCSPYWNLLNADSLGNSMSPLPGWGNYRWNISSTSDSARFYFNQGINMYYAFHIIESLGSFKKAATFDSTNAMIYWAQALAYGPNINDYAYSAAPDAVAAVQKAKQYSSKLSPMEKALINAMSVRYSLDSTISRETLNGSYAAAMQTAFDQFGKGNKANADLCALYADARMIQHPWNYWKHNGDAEPWTPEIIDVIEAALKKFPDHPGLNHYHIHISEASPDPGRALASAQRLETLMPDVSHMVHMPSHIYIRTGRYQTGINVNDKSITGYNKYLTLYPDVVNNVALYLIHNLHMKAACAMMLSDYSVALKAATECANSFDTSFLSLPQPLGNMVQYAYMTPLMAQVQYGKWDELLAQPGLPEKWAFGYSFTLWGKGLAYAETGKPAEAKKLLSALNESMKNPDLQVLNSPFNKPVDQMQVGKKILEGTIALKEKSYKQAIAFFKEAVLAEDNLIYTEPRDWLVPSRQFLANAYILSGNLVDAKKILKEDLVINPNNFHSVSLLQKLGK